MTGLDHVQLAMPAGEEDRAEAFYAGLLGLARQPKPQPLAARGGCWFSNGSVTIHLGVEDGFRPARKAHPAIVVDDLDDLVNARSARRAWRSGRTRSCRASAAATSTTRSATGSS